MNLVVDTSVIIAVLVNESERNRIIALTKGVDLVAPGSVHWEVGNALSAMIKRKRIGKAELIGIVRAYKRVPIRLVDIDMDSALQIAMERGIYAYDAYLVQCARESRCNLISLDRGLLKAAQESGVGTIEVPV